MTPERLQEIEASIGRIECPECGGSGVYLDVPTGNEACDECDGSGMVSQFPPADELIAAVRTLTADLAQARAETEEARRNYTHACQTIAKMHEAATGRTGEAPQRGVVEDMADIRAALTAAQEALRLAEWVPLVSGPLLWCSVCGQLQRDGHHRYCKVSNALAQAAPAQAGQ